MRNLFLFFAVTFILSECVVSRAGDFPYDSAVITYRVSGQTQNGEEILRVKGEKTSRRRNLTIKIFDRLENRDTLEIDDGEYVYNIDLNAKIGTKMFNPRKFLEDLSPSEREILDRSGRALVMGISGKLDHQPIGREKILGKECDVYQIEGIKSWLWEGIPLKTEMRIMGVITQEATDVRIDVPVSDNHFRVPGGIKITDITEQQKQLVNQNFIQAERENKP